MKLGGGFIVDVIVFGGGSVVELTEVSKIADFIDVELDRFEIESEIVGSIS